MSPGVALHVGPGVHFSQIASLAIARAQRSILAHACLMPRVETVDLSYVSFLQYNLV